MPWDILTTPVGEGGHTSFLRKRLEESIRKHWSELDTVTAQWRRSNRWNPVPFAIAVPKDPKQRKAATPEEGALLMWERTIAIATEHEARELRFEGYGTSTTGDSERVLFRWSCKPFDDLEDDEKIDKKAKLDNVAIEAANVLKDLVDKLGLHLDKHHHREIALLDKCDALLKSNTATTEQFVIGLGHARQMESDRMGHDERMASDAHQAAMFDKLATTFGGPLGNIFERYLAKHLDLDAKVFAGSFAARLLQIVKTIDASTDGNAKLEKMKTILGDDAWDVLQSMSKPAITDDAFKALGERFIELLGGDAKGKMTAVANVIGQGPALALLKLIHDAGLLSS